MDFHDENRHPGGLASATGSAGLPRFHL